PSVATTQVVPATSSPMTQAPVAPTATPPISTGAARLETSITRTVGSNDWNVLLVAPTYAFVPTRRTAVAQRPPTAKTDLRTGLSGAHRSYTPIPARVAAVTSVVPAMSTPCSQPVDAICRTTLAVGGPM